MDQARALEFLAAHQPMPDDLQVTQELLDGYRAALVVLDEHPSPACIPLFLNSFGERDLFGNYQRVAGVLRYFSQDEITPHLAANLAVNKTRSVRYWNAQMAQDFPDPSFLEPLVEMLREEDSDLRSAAVLALAAMNDPQAKQALREALAWEAEEDVKELMLDALAE